MAAVDPIETVPRARLILGFDFLYQRLVDVLDGQGTSLSGTVVEPGHSGLDAAVGPLVPDQAVLRARRPALARLREQLAPIVTGPAAPPDVELRLRLLELRSALEDVFGQRLTFDGEQRRPTGATVQVSQDLDTVQGLAVGADIDTDWADDEAGSHVMVNQNVRVVEKRGTAIGARLGGPSRQNRP